MIADVSTQERHRSKASTWCRRVGYMLFQLPDGIPEHAVSVARIWESAPPDPYRLVYEMTIDGRRFPITITPGHIVTGDVVGNVQIGLIGAAHHPGDMYRRLRREIRIALGLPVPH